MGKQKTINPDSPCDRCGDKVMKEGGMYIIYDKQYCCTCYPIINEQPICEACNLPTDSVRDGILSQKGKKLCITCWYVRGDFDIQADSIKEKYKIVKDQKERYENHLHTTTEEKSSNYC
ncbi:MAG TPA: hypothetical protein ENK81_01830, partial [Euryarchaeota archaeon]|nr:hypothetical protein [Euryarchaeota archaeon]